jgi:flagellin
MQETTSILQRMRELSVQSVNGTYDNANDRASMQDEVDQLVAEIDRISQNTSFNSTNILDGSVASVKFQVGANKDQQITATLSNVGAAALGVDGADVSTTSAANDLIDTIDSALNTLSGFRGDMGAIQNRLESTTSNLMNVAENLQAANGRIVDADFASETSNMTKQQILSQAGVAMLAQAKALPQQVLQLLQ